MKHSGKIVIDLDGVLAGPKPATGYQDCEVNSLVAQRVRDLKALGWTIAIHTSRNVKTHDHNMGRMIADTVSVIATWLTKHNIPYDEIWPGKPWTGTTGFYVDDRAIRPQEFVELTSDELLSRARGAFYDPAKPAWRVGNDQPWIVINLRNNPSALFSGDVIQTIEKAREDGKRALLIINAHEVIPVGYDEQLRRLGARWKRASGPTLDCLEGIRRELELDGDASAKSVFEIVTITDKKSLTLESRHFNSVVTNRERVVKSTIRNDNQKLGLEAYWLMQVNELVPNVAIANVQDDVDHASGYSMDYAAGGSLNKTLLHQHLDDFELRFIADEIARLWTELNVDLEPTYITNKKMLTPLQFAEEHDKFMVKKTMDRIPGLTKLGKDTKLWDAKTTWVVNGESFPPLGEVIKTLLKMIPVQKQKHRGVWHGDFCPGNIVLTHPIDSDDCSLRLIDPRATMTGEDLAFFGDRRYDLGKIAHALRWGYDGIVAGWRDVGATRTDNVLNVNYRLWDEALTVESNRSKLWTLLLTDKKITAGDVRLDSPVVLAITALQLITCAPLHKDDGERALVLICRGLEVFSNALAAAKTESTSYDLEQLETKESAKKQA